MSVVSRAIAHQAWCPRTFPGPVRQDSYLKSLGITAAELLPVTEFDETENPRKNPLTGEPLLDYWG